MITLEDDLVARIGTAAATTQVPNLMLTSSAPTQRDGNFNATTQCRLFRPDGNYYTAVPPTP